MIKKISIGMGALVLIFAGVCAYLFTHLDGIVKKGVETYGPRITQTAVTLRSVHLSPFSGRGSIHGLFIGSPAGFQEPEALALGEAGVSVDPKSVLSDLIVVHELSFVAPELHYERQKQGVNLDRLERNIQTAVPASAAPSEPQKPSKPKRIRIERFSARGGKVFVNFYGVKGQVPLPDVALDDIGGERGIEPKDAARAIFVALKQAAIKSVESSGIGRNLQQGIQGVQKQLKGWKGLFHK